MEIMLPKDTGYDNLQHEKTQLKSVFENRQQKFQNILMNVQKLNQRGGKRERHQKRAGATMAKGVDDLLFGRRLTHVKVSVTLWIIWPENVLRIGPTEFTCLFS